MADSKEKGPRDGADHAGKDAGEYSLALPVERKKEEKEARVKQPGEESAKPKTPAKEQGKPDFLSKLKQNPNLSIGVGTGVVILIIALSAGWWLGWFGGGKKVPPTPVAATTPAAATPQPVTPQPVTPQPTTPQQQPAAQVAQTSPAVQGSPGEPLPRATPSESPSKEPAKSADVRSPEVGVPEANAPPPALAEDVAKWKKEDYFRARQENSPLLLKAVEYLGQTAHSDAAAQGLADLLKRLPDEPFAANPAALNPAQAAARPPRNPGDSSKLVEAIMAALGNNGSELAYKTLEQILEGRLITEDDRMAVEATLRTLAAHPGAQNDALLLRAMTAAEALRPADRQGPWPARELRLRALELLKPAGPGDFRMGPGGPIESRPVVVSGEFRRKLAEAVAGRFEKFDPRDPIREYLLAADPLSCDAQIVIYANAGTSKDTRARLEQIFANYSSTALNRLMGLVVEEVPGAGMPAGQPPRPADADFDPQLVTSLWSDQFRTAFDPQLDDLRSWENKPQTVLLASTIPQESTRTALWKALRKHQGDGPKALETAGWIDRMTTDPGLLVIIKLLSRKEGKPSGPGQPPANQPRGPNPNATNKIEAARQASQKKAQAEQDWMALCSKLVITWCKRLNATVVAKEKVAAEAGQSLDDAKSKLPGDIELDAAAKVTVAYHVVWPDDMSSATLQQKPGLLDLYYVRVQETSRLKRATTFYCRQAKIKLAEVRAIDKGAWIESPRPPTAQSDRRRSLDVLITRSDEKAGDSARPDTGIPATGKADAAKDDEETDLVIEILSIEIKDPVVRE